MQHFDALLFGLLLELGDFLIGLGFVLLSQRLVIDIFRFIWHRFTQRSGQ